MRLSPDIRMTLRLSKRRLFMNHDLRGYNQNVPRKQQHQSSFPRSKFACFLCYLHFSIAQPHSYSALEGKPIAHFVTPATHTFIPIPYEIRCLASTNSITIYGFSSVCGASYHSSHALFLLSLRVHIWFSHIWDDYAFIKGVFCRRLQMM